MRCRLVYLMFFEFFFFKQKTAYEMRISDWSSDVCSSDLVEVVDADVADRATIQVRLAHHAHQCGVAAVGRAVDARPRRVRDALGDGPAHRVGEVVLHRRAPLARSAEHTSALQSLMRNSYAVFCLKKKITLTYNYTHT